MEQLLLGLHEFCSPYIDDINIYSSTWGEHIVHIKAVLCALKKAGLIGLL